MIGGLEFAAGGYRTVQEYLDLTNERLLDLILLNILG